MPFNDEMKWYVRPGYPVSESMVICLEHYVNEGVQPGDFLTAVLENNLVEAFARADDQNIRLIHWYVELLYDKAPAGCWGSPEKVERWVRHQGLRFSGLLEKQNA